MVLISIDLVFESWCHCRHCAHACTRLLFRPCTLLSHGGCVCPCVCVYVTVAWWLCVSLRVCVRFCPMVAVCVLACACWLSPPVTGIRVVNKVELDILMTASAAVDAALEVKDSAVQSNARRGVAPTQLGGTGMLASPDQLLVQSCGCVSRCLCAL